MRIYIIIIITFLLSYSSANAKTFFYEQRETFSDLIIEKLYHIVKDVFDNLDEDINNKCIDVEIDDTNNTYKIKLFYRKNNLDVNKMEKLNYKLTNTIRNKFGYEENGEEIIRYNKNIKIVNNLKEVNMLLDNILPENIDEIIFKSTFIEIIGKSRSDSVYCLNNLTVNLGACQVSKKVVKK